MICRERGNLDKLHKIQLEMISYIIDILNENNMAYYLIEGSLLGAVRHKGFIPWDDDIDIGMPREDYDKFIEIAPGKLGNGFKLITYNTQREAIRYFSQIESERVKVKTFAHKKETIRNAWIDIFPLDGLPNNHIIRKWHIFKILAIRALIQYSQFDSIVNIHQAHRPLHEKIMIWIGQNLKFGRNLDTIKLMRSLDLILRKYSYKNSKYIINSSSAYKTKAVFPSNYFGKGISYKFGNLLLNGPENWDAILTQLYGNYMELPPESERNTHCTVVLD